MNNYKAILKKSSDFLKIYFNEYLIALKMPFLVGLIGFLSIILCMVTPIGAIIALLIFIPCFCYAFWHGYLIAYSLNYAADSFAKTDNKVSLADCYDLAKKDSGELAKFLLFYAVVYFIVCIPSIIYLFFNFTPDGTIPTQKIFKCMFFLLMNNIILLPSSNFLNQAFFYRKKEESFSELLLNCYKKLDKTGILLSITFGSFMLLNSINSLICSILILILNPLVYCANTIWYKQKTCDD